MLDPPYSLTNIVSKLLIKGINSVFLKKLRLDLIQSVYPLFLVGSLKVTAVRHTRTRQTGL